MLKSLWHINLFKTKRIIKKIFCNILYLLWIQHNTFPWINQSKDNLDISPALADIHICSVKTQWSRCSPCTPIISQPLYAVHTFHTLIYKNLTLIFRKYQQKLSFFYIKISRLWLKVDKTPHKNKWQENTKVFLLEKILFAKDSWFKFLIAFAFHPNSNNY